MGAILSLFIFSLVGLAIACIICTGRGGYDLIMAIVRWIQHELLMRPKTRYYTF